MTGYLIGGLLTVGLVWLVTRRRRRQEMLADVDVYRGPRATARRRGPHPGEATYWWEEPWPDKDKRR